MTEHHFSTEQVICPQCGSQRWRKLTSQWLCKNGHVIPTSAGLPDFSAGGTLAAQDRKLRDRLYNGLLGRYYGFMMPLLSMPARPILQSLSQWAVFFITWIVLFDLLWGMTVAFSGGHTVIGCLLLALLLASGAVLYRHSYLFWLLLVAIPVKLILLLRPYKPAETFPDVHRRWVNALKDAGCEQVLDVSTGTCNSLLRHGWTSLGAQLHGVDLSTTMLLQGADNAAAAGVPIQLYVADAQAMPFPDACMDLVLNYGALNGYQDQGRALAEMARILKPGGVLVCLDEQLYDRAGKLEKLYFEKVLASHDTIVRFPREAVPVVLDLVELHQIYQFYYLAIMRKS